MIKKCLGCGIPLQCEDENKIGYTKSLEMNYCMRCFRLNHYHDMKIENHENIANDKILESVNQKDGFAFFFVDFLNLSHDSIELFQQIKMNKVFVISKCDIIPHSIYFNKIRDWLKNEFQVSEEVIFIEQKSKTSLEKIISIMKKHEGMDFYFLGMTNSGKSTFLNELNEHNDITVSELPNTTLDFIQIKTEHGMIYDTIGFYYPITFTEPDMLKKLNCKKEIKPITYPLKKNATLVIENKLYVNLDTDNFVTFFGSKNVDIHKIYDDNYDKKDKVNFSLKGNSNILLKGIGFIYIKKGTNINIYGINRDCIDVIPSFLGGSHE